MITFEQFKDKLLTLPSYLIDLIKVNVKDVYDKLIVCKFYDLEDLVNRRQGHLMILDNDDIVCKKIIYHPNEKLSDFTNDDLNSLTFMVNNKVIEIIDYN